MGFIFPGFLFALFAVAIPVLIHLFHFRRYRKVYFSNVSFLQQLSDESKKQSRLKHLLVLAARILAIVFLVLAFSRPYIPVSDSLVSMEGNAVSVYLDNSFSMDALSDGGTRLLDEGRSKARAIAEAYQPTDQFQLLTNDFEGRHQRFVGQAEFLSLLEDVDVSSVIRAPASVLQRQSLLFEENLALNRRAYLISDFQKSTSSFADMEADTLMATTLIPIRPQNADNVYIDSCWFASPVHTAGRFASLTVAIRNDGGATRQSQPLRLFIDGVQRSLTTYDVLPGETTTAELSWPLQEPGIYNGWVEIVDYPVTFDDRLYFSYRVSDVIPVLGIEEGLQGPYLGVLFDKDTLFSYDRMPAFSVDVSRFNDYNLIILSGLNQVSPGLGQALKDFVEQGGNLVVFPGQSIDFLSYEEFLSAMQLDRYVSLDTVGGRVGQINDQHLVYSGVFESIPEHPDLPRVHKHYVLARHVASESQYLMQLENGRHFFSSQAVGKGGVFLSAVPLHNDFSNFQRHALFVPTLVNIALQSQPYEPLYHLLGGNEPVIVRGRHAGTDQVFVLRGAEMEVIPEQRRTANQWQLFFHDQIVRAGNYSLYTSDSQVAGLSFNYDRRESRMESYSAEELVVLLQDNGLDHIGVIDKTGTDFSLALQEMRMGRQLWRLCLVLALLFLLAEVVMLRLWR